MLKVYRCISCMRIPKELSMESRNQGIKESRNQGIKESRNQGIKAVGLPHAWARKEFDG